MRTDRNVCATGSGGREGLTGSIRQRIPPGRQLLAIGIAAFLFFAACSTATISIGGWIVKFALGPDRISVDGRGSAVPAWPANSADLTVAVSPLMAETLQERADRFNSRKLRTLDGQRMRIEVVEMSPQEMAERSLRQPGFQALAPDSSLWLRRIDRRWAELFPAEPGSLPAVRVGESTRFALSPIVIAVRAEAALELGWPRQEIGWKEVQARAIADADFRWGHPGTDNTVGVLATLAELHAGAGTAGGLTEETASRPDALAYVREVEATVDFDSARAWRGDDRRGAIFGRSLLAADESDAIFDAFVTQEQTVVAWNHGGGRDRALAQGQWVAIYPKEGTLWADHPLALLELDGRAGPAVTRNQRRAYRAFTAFLLDEESQYVFLRAGYRPADPAIDLKAAPSPFADNAAVDALHPQNLFPIPSAPLMEMVLNLWRYTKRPANLYLVVDISESMEGDKLTKAKAALRAFVDQIEGDRDRIGLVEFGSGVKHFGSLQQLDRAGREHLGQAIGRMKAGGYTALVDAVWSAHRALQKSGDSEAVNAIVVMTDGRDNDSHYRLRDLQMAARDAHVPVTIYTVALGRDADSAFLQDLARIGGGQFHRADKANIEELYRQIATYFSPTE